MKLTEEEGDTLDALAFKVKAINIDLESLQSECV